MLSNPIQWSFWNKFCVPVNNIKKIFASELSWLLNYINRVHELFDIYSLIKFNAQIMHQKLNHIFHCWSIHHVVLNHAWCIQTLKTICNLISYVQLTQNCVYRKFNDLFASWWYMLRIYDYMLSNEKISIHINLYYQHSKASWISKEISQEHLIIKIWYINSILCLHEKQMRSMKVWVHN